jgi:DNA mismatch repair protein MSH2
VSGIIDELFTANFMNNFCYALTAEYHATFEQLGNILAFLDVILSFATVAANASSPYIRPKLRPKGTGILRFEQLRHPCVESQSGVNFIPNDVLFEKGKESFFIVTGYN